MGWRAELGSPCPFVRRLLAGFGACYACFASELASWFALLSSMSVAGAAVPFTGLPITRLYDPLERVSGYAFG